MKLQQKLKQIITIIGVMSILFTGSIIVDSDDVNDDVIKVYEDTTQVKDTQDY